MSEIPIIETPRMILRPWRENDLEPYATMCADPETMRFMRTGAMTRKQTTEQIQMLVGHWQEHGFGLWAVEERASGRFIGRVGLMHREDWTAGPHKVDVGWLVDRELWGQGFATEAALASLGWGLEELGEGRIISIIRPDNDPSRKVAEKCGLRYRGEARWKGVDWIWYDVGRDGLAEAVQREHIF